MAARNTQHPEADHWRQIVTSLYPDAATRTYCVPPVYFNRVPYVRDVVPGTGLSVHVLQPRPSARFLHKALSTNPEGWTVPQHMWAEEPGPHLPPVGMQDSDLRDDFAQNHVMLNLQELGDSRHEAMFILSQLQFGSYLNEPAYAAAAKQLPRPKDLPQRDRQGDFDFLLIHRQHGILVGELKSVGKNQGVSNQSHPPADPDLADKVERAVKQLDKSERMVRHLVSDIGHGMTVKKTLFLPYVSSAQLERVLDNDAQLEQALCQSLGAANSAEAVQLCCCSDQLSQPASYWHVTPAVLSELSTWWQHRMACTVDTRITDQLYLDIVARFVGPATTVSVPCYNNVRVEVRTAGQAVAELGRRLALLVLTLQQLGLLNRDPPRVCITGAPGTGKTVVLVLQGVRWLREGHDVHVLSTWYETRAVSTSITQQLGMSLSAGPTPFLTPGSVSYHQYDFQNRKEDVEKAVTDLVACLKNGHLYVLLDEAFFDSSEEPGPPHIQLVSQLAQRVPHLYLWCATVYNDDIPPALQTQVFTVPLRSAPAVLREIQQGVQGYDVVHDYSDSGVPAPGDGLSVIRLSHHGNAHTCRWPLDCAQCGQDIAAVLRRLGVGSSVANSPSRLSYSDVFVLTRSDDLHDDVTDEAGQVTSPASGVVQGLKAAGVPVSVLGVQDWRHNRARWERAVQDVAVAATDTVTVAGYDCVTGLERRVVAVLPGRHQSDDDDGWTDEEIDRGDRLDAVSRCTTQLIMVRTPPVTTDTRHPIQQPLRPLRLPTPQPNTTTTTTATTATTTDTTSDATTTTTTTTTINKMRRFKKCVLS